VRSLKVVVVVLVAGLMSLWAAGAAAADCAGPTIEHSSGPMDRGSLITVKGTGFGSNCYDTGPPPEGEGIMGKPLQAIEVAFVQGDTDVVVASGSADTNYEFAVDVAVPSTLQPGDVTVVARWGNGAEAANCTLDPLVVSDTAAQPGNSEVVGFGPRQAPPSTGDGDDGTDLWVMAGAAAVLAVATVGITSWLLRRSRLAAD
jgi:hypothetical protein